MFRSGVIEGRTITAIVLSCVVAMGIGMIAWQMFFKDDSAGSADRDNYRFSCQNQQCENFDKEFKSIPASSRYFDDMTEAQAEAHAIELAMSGDGILIICPKCKQRSAVAMTQCQKCKKYWVAQDTINRANELNGDIPASISDDDALICPYCEAD